MNIMCIFKPDLTQNSANIQHAQVKPVLNFKAPLKYATLKKRKSPTEVEQICWTRA